MAYPVTDEDVVSAPYGVDWIGESHPNHTMNTFAVRRRFLRRVRSKLTDSDGRKATPYFHSSFAMRGNLHSYIENTSGMPPGRYGFDALGARFPNDLYAPFFNTSGRLIWSNSTISKAVNRAQLTAYNRLNDHKYEFGLALAELRSTLSEFTTLGIRVGRDLNAILRFRRSKRHRDYLLRRLKALKKDPGSSALSAVTQSWLLYNLGVMPTMSDMRDLLHLILRGESQLLYVSSSGRSACHTSVSRNIGALSKSSCRHNILASCRLYGRLDPSFFGSAAELGFHWSNLPSIAYERVPFSFVVDYFYPVGDMLRAVAAPQGVTFLDGYRSVKVNSRGVYNHAERHYTNLWPYGRRYIRHTGSLPFDFSCYERAVLTAWPNPIRPVPFNTLTGRRGVTLLALIDQLKRT